MSKHKDYSYIGGHSTLRRGLFGTIDPAATGSRGRLLWTIKQEKERLNQRKRNIKRRLFQAADKDPADRRKSLETAIRDAVRWYDHERISRFRRGRNRDRI